MSLEIVVGRSRQVEGKLLELGATGRGLNEKATSIEQLLGQHLTRRIRFLATIRNKALHDPDFDVTDELLTSFLSAAESVLGQLQQLLQTAKPTSEKKPTSENQRTHQSGNAPVGLSLADAWRDTSTTGKVGIVAGVLALGALYVKGEIEDWW
uniref:hypothetical protein n=1 Tax=uncultured Acidovorax sp. TaxID=158751 RepID=UPI0025F8C978|nr:hypothetical protein [uncultured Acidovorax sp.]